MIKKTKKKEGGAKRAQRASSNVFSMFEQTQIQEFKEAFTLIDQNRDGFIDKEDLKDTYASLGKLNVKDNELEDMLKEATGPINFTMFLNLFGEKLHGQYHSVLQSITQYYRVLYSTTEYHSVLQSIIQYYRVSLSTTEYYTVLQSITQYYRVLYKDIFVVHLSVVSHLLSQASLCSSSNNRSVSQSEERRL
uniref:Myosin light chain 5 n=1 Tax=Seriola lalandi dorsalis TaxID=1841481 RepID=A0A3B4XAU6_SERLL